MRVIFEKADGTGWVVHELVPSTVIGAKEKKIIGFLSVLIGYKIPEGQWKTTQGPWVFEPIQNLPYLDSQDLFDILSQIEKLNALWHHHQIKNDLQQRRDVIQSSNALPSRVF